MTDPHDSPGAIVVTGAATGIGLEVVREQLRRGYHVWGLGLDAAEADDFRCRSAEATFEFIETDVTDEAAVARAFVAIARGPWSVVGLVNCAGVYPSPARLEDTHFDDWRKVLQVNLDGTFLVCRAALPALREAGGGAIVNIASVHAIAAAPGQPAYAASKAAIVGLTRQIAVDYASDRIRANCILAGAVDTRITRAAIAEAGSPEALALTFDATALGRIGSPLEIAQVVAFLLGSDSRFITGSALTADAGMTARIL
jgi:NAD(P)-dependent dehydrogenase (short-subunit alcohol dehydrogenase family)